jgi:outer membrane protein assembly factor BamB
MKVKYLILFLCTISISAQSQEILEWRGGNRTGMYSETNLLKTWPAEGPALLWEFPELGNGYGSPIITTDRIFVNGEIDTISYVFALDLNGKMLWKTPIGAEWVASYPGSRTTPTYVDGLLYVTAGMGVIACIDAVDGKVKWKKDMVKDFKAPLTRFGFSESPVIDDDMLLCTPGNADTNIVALNRYTGELIWKNKGLGQMTSYCSPLLLKCSDKNVLITFTKSALLGIDAKTGKTLWHHIQDGEGDVHINTPMFIGGYLYYVTGDGNGSVKLKLSDDGTEISEVWRNKACDNTMGGFVISGNYLYTSGYEKRNYYTLDVNTGQIVDSVKFDRGVIISADNMYYLYNEKGNMGLFRATGTKLEQVSAFKVTRGTKAHYAHPVINKGVLYIRHGKSLLAYDIKAKS